MAETDKNYQILQELQSNVKTLKKSIDLLSYQYNLVLDRLNTISGKLESQKTINQQTQPDTQKQSIREIKPTLVSSVEEPPLDAVPKALLQKQKQKEEVVEVVQKKKDIVIDEAATMVPITQILYNKNGKPMSLAQIEITNNKGDVVARAKTNSVGRWQALVPEGSHTVRTLRKYNDIVVDFKQEITVQSTGKNIEILPPEEYRIKKK